MRSNNSVGHHVKKSAVKNVKQSACDEDATTALMFTNQPNVYENISKSTATIIFSFY